mmetsp:Transcript_76843/g.222052  ORF Transcript_76843/g.222052 Transcript_76843/m.222052 type:complete len:237 (-) Transcript_76843:181-891(-)
MRRQPLRAAGAGVVTGGARSPEATLRPGEGAAESSAGPSLEALEQEVRALREALEQEHSEIQRMESGLAELHMRNACEEYLHRLERRIQVLENKEVDTVQWRIENIEEVRRNYSKGQFLASPEFSAGGLDGFSFHLYPRGDDFAEEGYCSLYFHVPRDTRISRTLFLGRTRHGPAEADSLKNCGISEMCVLSNEIDKATGSIVIGVEGLQILSSPNIAETRTKLTLDPPRPAPSVG